MHGFSLTLGFFACLLSGLVIDDTRAAPVGDMPPAVASADTTTPASAVRDGSRDFDFLLGQWTVHNRRLLKRMAGSHDWVEFDAQDEFHPLPGGIGTQEHYRTGFWKDFEAVGLHLYDPRARRWTLYWVDNHNAPGILQPPASGAFDGDTGIFTGTDTLDGKPITVRFSWKRLDRNHVRWEQAFSSDTGASWETNWTMDFVRR